MPSFAWITYLQARQQLAARLADPSMVFWTDAELKLYLTEALRVWNSLTEQFNADFAFTATSASTWYNLASLVGSPRLRTLKDSDLYQILQAHLLEPITGGGSWTGTSQFSLSDLQGALQRRRDEVIQFSGCNVAQLPPLPSAANVRRVYFPDSTLEPRRTRFLPDSTASAVTLSREDTLAFDAFEPAHLQTTRIPMAWSVITGPPLALDVDTAPGVTGSYDVLALQSGPIFSPPTPTLLGIPDDFAWVPKLGAMADLLSRDSEATDMLRAEYYAQRYADALVIMKQSNWLVSATINGLPVDTPSVRELDAFSPEWQDNPTAWPALVQAGPDFVAPCPVPTGATTLGVSMILLGNATVPVLDADFVQISRDSFDAVLAYAQWLAIQKQGGAEFKDGMALEKQFLSAAMEQNKRLMKLGIFADIVHSQGKRQDRIQPR